MQDGEGCGGPKEDCAWVATLSSALTLGCDVDELSSKNAVFGLSNFTDAHSWQFMGLPV